jgi:hypothetical protein
MSETIKSYKGFDKDLKSRGFQFEVGKEYEESDAIVCRKGFHACEAPIDVFAYYPPTSSRYCEVEQYGKVQRHNEDSKVASSKIKIGEEVGIAGIVKAQIEWVKAHTTTEHTDPKRATAGYRGAATAGDSGAATAGEFGAATAGDSGAATAGECGAATAGDRGAATAGDRGAATAGDRGAATAGYRGAATAGDRGAATAGDRGAATAGECGAATAGDRGAATAGECGAATAGECGAATAGDSGAATSRGSSEVGQDGLAVARGNHVKVKGGIGAVLVLCEEKADSYEIKDWKAVIVDGTNIKADTWYSLKDGNLVALEE